MQRRVGGDTRGRLGGAAPPAAATTIVEEAAGALPPLVERVEEGLSGIAGGSGGAERLRKTRAALRRIEVLTGTLGCGFDSERTARLAKKVRRLKRKAGRVRDVDVVIRDLNALLTGENEAVGKAGREVVHALESRRARRMKKFRSMAAEAAGVIRKGYEIMMRAPAEARAGLPSRCAAAVVLAREAEAMHAAARTPLDTTRALHELRLSVKEARTVLEVMSPTLGHGAAGVGARLKRLSGVLGAANDLAVVIDVLKRMERNGSGPRRDGATRLMDTATRAHAEAHRAAVVRAKAEIPGLARAVRRVAMDGREDGRTSRVSREKTGPAE